MHILVKYKCLNPSKHLKITLKHYKRCSTVNFNPGGFQNSKNYVQYLKISVQWPQDFKFSNPQRAQAQVVSLFLVYLHLCTFWGWKGFLTWNLPHSIKVYHTLPLLPSGPFPTQGGRGIHRMHDGGVWNILGGWKFTPLVFVMYIFWSKKYTYCFGFAHLQAKFLLQSVNQKIIHSQTLFSSV